MKKYKDSIQFLLLALGALLLIFIWEDLAFLSSVAFIALIIMAVRSAFITARKQSFAATTKLLWIFSAIILLLIVLGFTVMNPPQCPYSYTQEQINEANGSCIIGANIGVGMYFIFIVLPAAIGVIVMWGMTLFSRLKSHKKT